MRTGDIKLDYAQEHQTEILKKRTMLKVQLKIVKLMEFFSVLVMKST